MLPIFCLLLLPAGAAATEWPSADQIRQWRSEISSPDAVVRGHAGASLSRVLLMPATDYYTRDSAAIERGAHIGPEIVYSGAMFHIPAFPVLDQLIGMTLPVLGRDPNPIAVQEVPNILRAIPDADLAGLMNAMTAYFYNHGAVGTTRADRYHRAQSLLCDLVKIPRFLAAFLDFYPTMGSHDLPERVHPVLAEIAHDPRVVTILTSEWNQIVGNRPAQLAARKAILLTMLGLPNETASPEITKAIDTALKNQNRNYSLSQLTRDLFRLSISSRQTPNPMAAEYVSEAIFLSLIHYPEVRRTLLSELSRTEKIRFFTSDHLRTNEERFLSFMLLREIFPSLTAFYSQTSSRISAEEADFLLTVLRWPHDSGSERELLHQQAIECALEALGGNLSEVPARDTRALIELLREPIQRYRTILQRTAAGEVTHFREGVPQPYSDLERNFIRGMQVALERFNPFHGVVIATVGNNEADQLKLLQNIKNLLTVPESLRELTFPGSFTSAFDRLVNIEYPTEPFVSELRELLERHAHAVHEYSQLTWSARLRDFFKYLPYTIAFGRLPAARNPVTIHFSKKQTQALAQQLETRFEKLRELIDRYNEQHAAQEMNRRPGVERVRVADSVVAEGSSPPTQVRVAPNADETATAGSTAPNAELDESCLATSLGNTAAAHRRGEH